jgi:hypothetical protein
MVELGEPWDVAGGACGYSARSMRKALEKPWVIAFLRQRRVVFREAAYAANILKLCELRDGADNSMAQLGAIKALEQLGENDEVQAKRAATGVGIVIIVGKEQHQQAAPVTIDVTPYQPPARQEPQEIEETAVDVSDEP